MNDSQDQTDSSKTSQAQTKESQRGPLLAGRYQLLERLGMGAAGVVFKAADRECNNAVVALKVLAPMDFQDPTARKRFEKEITLTHEFQHQNIVRVFDFGQTETGQNYITMECVEGGTLGAVIRDQRESLDFAKTLRILRDIATGVAFAHSHGIVHRDLKPDNILMTLDGVSKVADFGLARQMDGGYTITQSADTVGTPNYMAPEQFQSHRVDARADVYSLGIMAFEMVTGRRPFEAEVYPEIARRHMYELMPSFYEEHKDVIPKWYETFVLMCTEKKLSARYQSMDEVLVFLENKMKKLGLIEGQAKKETFFVRLLTKLLGED